MSEKGLADVVAAQTAISDIDGQLGKLWYVGYDIDELAESSTFEETVFLLQNQRLPSQDELDDIAEHLVNDRE
ncbi:MAG: citrate synthase, partial [Actinobacteria bacterium]|nr:citrate synthase [Actinomycetota bacterium]